MVLSTPRNNLLDERYSAPLNQAISINVAAKRQASAIFADECGGLMDMTSAKTPVETKPVYAGPSKLELPPQLGIDYNS